MSDRYGPLELPAQVVEGAAGDPCLALLLRFAEAVLNANVQEAWEAVCPKKKVVERTFACNPETESFIDTALPAIYGFRKGGKTPERTADDWKRYPDTIVLWWVFPLQKQTVAALRAPIIGALAKALDAAIFRTRHPAFVDPDDLDPNSPTLPDEPEVVLTQKPTSTSAQSYSGAGLDGAKAGGPFSPPRSVRVAVGGDPSAFVDGSFITVHGTDVLDQPVQVQLVLETARLPATLYTPISLKSVTAIDVDAQASTAGTIDAGLRTVAGYGTSLCSFGQVDLHLAKSAVWKGIKIPQGAKVPPKVYPAIEFSIEVMERLETDLSLLAQVGQGIDQYGDPVTGPEADVAFVAPDGTVIINASYPT